MKPIPSTAKEETAIFFSYPMTLHGICENETDCCCLDARGFCAASLEQLHSQGKVQNSFVTTVHLQQATVIMASNKDHCIVKTGNAVHTTKSRTRVIYFFKGLAHFRSKRTGGFSPHTIHRLSYWRYSTVKHVRRKEYV
jgi:hypothetical protein